MAKIKAHGDQDYLESGLTGLPLINQLNDVKNRSQYYIIAILACLTLGLAPFIPEPHLVGKLRWIFGGGKGMGALDYLDLTMHGAPFVFLIGLILKDILSLTKAKKESDKPSVRDKDL